MKKYMALMLLFAVVAACLVGCGRGDQAQNEEVAADAATEDVLAENNLVPVEDTISFLEYCDGAITLRFSLEEEGAKWVWVDEPTFPLDGTQVEEIITALKELGQLQQAPPAADLEVYGLSDPQKYLTVKGETVDGMMYIGDQAEDGSWFALIEGYESVFVLPDAFVQRLSRNVYDMALLPTLPAFTAENLLSVTVESSESSIRMTQVDGQWNSAKEKVSARAEEVINTLASLQMSKCFDFLPSKQALAYTGFSAPTAKITVEYLNTVNVESTFTLTLGALRSAEEGYYATMNDDSTIYLVQSAQISPLLVLLIYAK